ncbi:MAG: iron ABC transporter permease [Candidatus Bipolaricaulota bacterium]|nr:iron ABC transporter permease [Candidatus Bipolaricaulota bacterium]
MKRWKSLLVLSSLSALLVGAIALGIALGAVPLSPFDADPTNRLILTQIRLPRVLLAALVGGALALCGAVMQGLFRNPLADPYLLGIASGATAGAALTIALHLDIYWGFVPLGAFLGGVLAVAIVYRVAQTRWARLDNYALILSGVALAALFSAVTSFLLFYGGAAHDARRLIFWILGGLGGAQWLYVFGVLGTLVVAGMVVLLFARDLNALALGEEMAAHLGIEPRHLRKILLVAVTLLTAVAVAVSGTIGFVGLIVPHILRLIVGPDHRLLLPVSALGGAVLLTLCDAVARTVLAPAELPLGIITALLGAPFFLFLLRRRAQIGATL